MNSSYTKEQISLISNKKIGIAGCGGLGSNAALNLVRLGFSNFKIVDFDSIELSNLNRQFYFHKQIGIKKVIALEENLKLVNPNINIEPVVEFLSKDNILEIFSDCDYVVEGFDKVNSKIMFTETIARHKPCVIATGLGFFGDVEGILTKRLNNNLTVVGDFSSDTDEEYPPLSPGVSIASAKQAAVILNYTLGGKSC